MSVNTILPVAINSHDVTYDFNGKHFDISELLLYRTRLCYKQIVRRLILELRNKSPVAAHCHYRKDTIYIPERFFQLS